MMTIKVFGWHCPECDETYANIITALQLIHLEAVVEKVENPEELVKNHVFNIPVVKVDGEVRIKGRVPPIVELRDILLN